MKIDQLRKIIREEVRAAVKEELQDVITEAVKIASAPTIMQPAPQPGTSDWSAPKKPSRQELAEMIGIKSPPKQTNVEFSKNESLNSILQQTQKSMTNEDYQQVFSGTSDMVQKPNFASAMASQMGMTGNQPGLDISKLDFVSKAKSVLDASIKKDKQRLGQL
jgi:hypothetical protein